MALSGTEYLIAVMVVFPLFFVILVLFLFGEMTRNVITRTKLLPLPSATFMVEEGPSHGRGGSFPWPRGGPSLDRALDPAQILTWASRFYTPTIAPQNPVVRLLGRRGGFWCRRAYVMACQVLSFINVRASSFARDTFLVVRHSFSLPMPRS